MGNDNKTVRNKILDWQFFVKTYGLFYITLLGLSPQAVQECIENQLKNSYVKFVAEVHFMDRSATSDQMSLPINDLP